MENKNFCHLHLHTEFSALDGYGSPEAYAEKAGRLGFDSIAMTDHGNIDASIRFQRACLKNGVSPVIGCEMYIDEDRKSRGKEAKRNHINVYVKNKKGWKNLLRMLTIANLEGFVHRPRIDPETLLRHSEGLCFASACMGGYIRQPWGKKLLKDLSDKHPGDVYLEIMPHDWTGQQDWNKMCLELAKEHGVKVIATNDCHYPDKENAISQEILLAIATASDWENPKRYRFEANTLYFCERSEMVKYFKENHPYLSKKEIDSSLNTTMEIAEKCNKFRIDQCEVHLPGIPQCKNGKEDSFFLKLIRKGWKRKEKAGLILKKNKKVYQERLEEETSLLVEKGFAKYFLIVWELMNWCEANKILTGPGRGSVGGSLVSWLLGITEVDPIKYELVFSRFISPERNDLPDIDLDFDRDRRQEVIEHCRDLYGKNNVIQITTFLKLKGKMALQDVGRIFGVNRGEISKINKLFDEGEELSVKTFKGAEEEEVRNFYKNNKDIVKKSIALQGCIRGYGKHAAGVCISSKSLTSGAQCNLTKRNGAITANWDKNDCEYMGLMKLDILGLSALSRIDECVKLIKENHGVSINVKSLDVEGDKNVFHSLQEGDCTGIFQLGTHGITKFCGRLKIDSFKDIYNATALYRPGTLRSGMADEFIDRKHGKKYKAIHPKVKELTKDTYGIILYQEQVMIMAKDLAGFSWGMCDKMRKVIAKSQGAEEFNVFKKDFVSGCIGNKTLNKKQALELFDQIVSFSAYGFNKAHAVEYSVISYWDAWLKYYYKAEFYASCLSYLDKEKKKQILKKSGIGVSLPKLGISDAKMWRVHEGKLVMPFIEIHGVGDTTAEMISKNNKSKNKGFFRSSTSFNIPGKCKKVLNEIRAHDKKYAPSYNDIKSIESYFEYNLYDILDV